jgi:hypothetical protein
VQSLYSVPGDKVHVIYNGIDVTRFDTKVDTRAARRQYAIGAEDPLVLFAGRMTRQKGPDILVEALPQVLDEHPRAKFIFAGEGDLRTGLEHRAEALGVAPATRFVGYRQGRELVSLFKSADLVCVPSRNEPFGIVILEAWSAGKPVVATRNGGPAEFVKDRDTGITVSDDRDSIGWGVGTVLADEPSRERMGHNGRREAESRFSWETVAAATEGVYESVFDTEPKLLELGRGSIEETFGMARAKSSKKKTKATAKKTASAPVKKPTSSTVADATKKATMVKKSTTVKTASTAKSTRKSTQATKIVQKSKPVSEVAPGMVPSTTQIQQRAYEIFVARGATPGRDQDDWLQAERELHEELAQRTTQG